LENRRLRKGDQNFTEKVVVTGGAGFIGSHLARALADRGYFVVAFDSLLRGRKEYLKDLIDSEKAQLVIGDIRNYELISDVVQGAKYVFHEAAVCINYSVANPSESFDINIKGTYNVFKASKEAKVNKVIFSSSASVYGNPVHLPMDEGHPLNPITPYCVAKITGENMLRMSEFKDMPSVTFRNFNVYGPRQSTDAYYTSVIISFIKRALQGLPPRIIGEGAQSMDFVHVRDIVRANLEAIDDDVSGEIINIGSSKSVSINEIAQKIIKLSGKSLVPEHQDGPKLIVQRRQAGIEKARKLLGFEPKVGLDEGLAELMQDYRTHPDLY
jgi:UDP-glucose 4-epimerase